MNTHKKINIYFINQHIYIFKNIKFILLIDWYTFDKYISKSLKIHIEKILTGVLLKKNISKMLFYHIYIFINIFCYIFLVGYRYTFCSM